MSREPDPAEDPKDKATGKAPSEGDDRKPNGKRARQIVTGAAIGIGSAAIVAALLYANRGRKGGEKS